MADERGLTVGEVRLCKTIFRDTIPTGMVKIIKRKVSDGGFTPFGRINMHESKHRADYIGSNILRPPDIELARLFTHELAHVWQHHVGLPKIRMFFQARRQVRRSLRQAGEEVYAYTMRRDMYYYRIDRPGMDLLDFNLEQQCDIIEDYFADTLWADKPYNAHGPNYPVPTIEQLIGVLSRFLSDPSYPLREGRGNARRADRRH
jgi:hypothetical protein